MTIIDPSKYLTVEEAMAAIGCSRRALYRAMDRVGRDEVSLDFLGRRLIFTDKLPLLQEHYYPYYSDAHQNMVKEWGRRGGTQKGINRKKAERKAKKKPAPSSSSDTTGTEA